LTWQVVDAALRKGRRGLPGGASLAKLLAEERGRKHFLAPTPLTLEQILHWVETFHESTRSWPTQYSGPVAEVDGETWLALDAALKKGARGLPVRTTLTRLVRLYRNVLLRVHPEIPLSDGKVWGGTPAAVTARILIREAQEEPAPRSIALLKTLPSRRHAPARRSRACAF
jgi:hypothetical protein